MRLLAPLMLLACPAPDDPGSDLPAATGDGLFLHGCPVPGRAAARQLTDAAERPTGPDALAAPGDVVLLNAHAAFVIQDPATPRTYYHYGGIPIDAVAVDGCSQAAPETFGELGFVIGQLDLLDFTASNLRMFRGDRMEIVSDGADGGPAVVDVHGTDDRFWLVELDLIRQAFRAGKVKHLPDPWRLDVTVRYTLDPEATALGVEVRLDPGDGPGGGFLTGALLFPSDLTQPVSWSDMPYSLGGLGLDTQVPWLGLDGPTSYAVAMPGSTMGRTEVSGCTALVALDQAWDALVAGSGRTARMLVSADAGGLDAAIAGAVAATPAADAVATLVTHAGSATPADGGVVHVDRETSPGAWREIDRAPIAPDGAFTVHLPDLVDRAPRWRLRATAPGHADSAPVVLDGLPTAPTALDLGRPGSLTWDLRDGDGAEIPARVELLRDGALVTRIYATPLDRRAPVAPGAYTARVSRGYEYTIWEGPVEVPPDGEATLSVTLERVIDTTGWMSMDSHVHAADSPDSDVSNADRARTAAAAGLEVIISTDHEIVSSIDAGVQAVGLDDHVATVVGQEVTATIPEHTNAFPMTPDPTLPRGGNPPWYGEDLAGVFALERERGAGVVQLNHPRLGCSWMCMIQWNRITGEADYPDPTALSFGPDAHLWDWNFDAIEYMNGNRSPLLDPAIPDASGLLDDWLAFLNLGHRITAMGVTDVHGLELPGEPRTYYVSPTDAPSAFDERDMVDAILGGRAQVSAGAFARVDIDGAGPGEDVTVDGVGHLRVHIEALPEIDVTRAQVLVNCDEVAVIEATDPGGVVKLDATLDLALDRDAHVVVLAFGEAPMPAALDDYDADRVPRVTTNAIFVDADGDGAWTPPGGKACAYSVGPR